MKILISEREQGRERKCSDLCTLTTNGGRKCQHNAQSSSGLTKLRKQRSTAAQGQGHRQCQSKGLGEEPKGIEDESCCLRAAETGTVIVENINIVELVKAEQEFCEEWMILCHLG